MNDADAENKGIDLDSAWPISDEEVKELTGYTFTVTNNCNEEINYIVGLNRVEEESANYLLDSSVKLQSDDNSTFLYSDLSDVEYVDPDNTEYTAISSKQVSVETISANGTNTHTIRVWIDEDAPVEEQSKTFLGQIFITGGQGIEVPSLNNCYKISSNGIILHYDSKCGTEVKVPAEINGIKVTEISTSSFRNYEANAIIAQNKETEEIEYILYYRDNTNKELIENYFKSNFCEDDEICDLSSYMVILNDEVEYESFNWDNYIIYSESEPLVYSSEDELNLQIAPLNISSLDLSEAVYLHTIAGSSFSAENSDDESLASVILPKNGMLKTIGAWSFYGNDLLNSVIIPSTVETIGESAFDRCSLVSLKIIDTYENPSKLSLIDGNSFSNNKLSNIVIPKSVATIRFSAFYNNPNLTDVIIKNTEGNVTVDSTAFPSATQVTYNPNYTE